MTGDNYEFAKYFGVKSLNVQLFMFLKQLMIKQSCPLPPVDWHCSRERGHEGPCAARHIKGIKMQFVFEDEVEDTSEVEHKE